MDIIINRTERAEFKKPKVQGSLRNVWKKGRDGYVSPGSGVWMCPR